MFEHLKSEDGLTHFTQCQKLIRSTRPIRSGADVCDIAVWRHKKIDHAVRDFSIQLHAEGQENNLQENAVQDPRYHSIEVPFINTV